MSQCVKYNSHSFNQSCQLGKVWLELCYHVWMRTWIQYPVMHVHVRRMEVDNFHEYIGNDVASMRVSGNGNEIDHC